MAHDRHRLAEPPPAAGSIDTAWPLRRALELDSGLRLSSSHKAIIYCLEATAGPALSRTMGILVTTNRPSNPSGGCPPPAYVDGGRAAPWLWIASGWSSRGLWVPLDSTGTTLAGEPAAGRPGRFAVVPAQLQVLSDSAGTPTSTPSVTQEGASDEVCDQQEPICRRVLDLAN